MSDDQHIDALRGDIDQTRGDMSQTIAQLQERLAPERLQRDTGEIVQEVVDRIVIELQGKTGDLTAGLSAHIQAAVHGAATAKSEELLTHATAGARTAGALLWERVAKNPAPVALASVAIGLLAAGGRTSAVAGHADGGLGATGTVDELLAQANTVVGRVTDTAAGAGQRATEAVDRAKNAIQGGAMTEGSPRHAVIGNQPVLAGLVALGLGLATGLALPQTEAERGAAAPMRERVQDRLSDVGLPTDAGQMMARAKDHLGALTEQAKTTATAGIAQTRQVATELAEGAKHTASSAASERGLLR